MTSDLEARGPITLSVNADGLSPDAFLRAELLDHAERPLPGFSGQRAALVCQPGLRVPVAWSGGPSANLPAAPFKIKATFDGPLRGAASLYALYVGPEARAARCGLRETARRRSLDDEGIEILVDQRTGGRVRHLGIEAPLPSRREGRVHCDQRQRAEVDPRIRRQGE